MAHFIQGSSYVCSAEHKRNFLFVTAKKHLLFLGAFDRNRCLYDGPALQRAILRYNAYWLPLLAQFIESSSICEGPLVPPLDCEWVWHCHMLNPVRYKTDCEQFYGRVLDNSGVLSSVNGNRKSQTETLWKRLYHTEPYDFDFAKTKPISLPAHVDNDVFLQEAVARYKAFLYLIKINRERSWSMMIQTLTVAKVRSLILVSLEPLLNGKKHLVAGQSWRGKLKNLAVLVPKSEHGKFYMGDTYIVLQDEAGTAAIKTVELDAVLGEGGVVSGFKTVEEEVFETQLYTCKGKRAIRFKKVPFARSSLNHDDVFILDTEEKIYQFNGANSNIQERAKALEVVQYLKDKYHEGTCDVAIVDDGKLDTESDSGAFWVLFGGFAPIGRKVANDDDIPYADAKCYGNMDVFNILKARGAKVPKTKRTPMVVANPREVPEYELNPQELQVRKADGISKA
ncbi:unnamed protein product [Arabidopsis thaliana]|uniref:(thale cress) hypothetical protein n=1 Tax=Arabidopsis thaliana TaxID=3702 RepID=A0A7G2EQV1_ARATH|nr:unnamed protein product [Arabidopsis thaliana]